jgi:hypothetical protein
VGILKTPPPGEYQGGGAKKAALVGESSWENDTAEPVAAEMKS